MTSSTPQSEECWWLGLSTDQAKRIAASCIEDAWKRISQAQSRIASIIRVSRSKQKHLQNQRSAYNLYVILGEDIEFFRSDRSESMLSISDFDGREIDAIRDRYVQAAGPVREEIKLQLEKLGRDLSQMARSAFEP